MDEKLFTHIYETYFSNVYNYISYRINNHNDTEDLTSQVFSKVIEKFNSYNKELGCYEAWIIGIAKNIVTDYFRKTLKHKDTNIDLLSNQLSSEKTQPEEICIKNEANRSLILALNTLNNQERNMIALKYATGLKNKDIAQIMGLSESNTGVILFRSIKKLRLELCKEETQCKKGMKAGKTI